jgi:hypothetical protein
MIRHIVFFSARDPAEVDLIEAGLKPLETIAAATVLEVRRNLGQDQLGNEIDIVVYGEFRDEAALAAYKADPRYVGAIRIVRPLREHRFAADIASGGHGERSG